MTHSPAPDALPTGIAVIHSNKLEVLRDVVAYWLRQHPLAPLENETVLVQSSGMGQWLKHGLAQTQSLGIAAALSVQLPSAFIWRMYRAVLGEAIPKEQPLAKAPLTWRLYRLLPALIEQPAFAALKHFLTHHADERKRHQLAEQLADLFDQYQVYRADWLTDWAHGRDRVRDGRGIAQPMPEAQRWQAALWRRLLEDLAEAATAYASRASVHEAFLQQIDKLTAKPDGVPRRVIVFGLSSLPQQTLEALAKLARFCQIVLFVHNPCRYYWADLIEDKELLKAERRRHALKTGVPTTVSDDEWHLYAPPLLAAWGKQGRDYIRLLDHFDDTKAYANWQWPDDRIDLFEDYGEPAQRSLLQRLQQAILDLEPVPESPQVLPAVDASIQFHIAHSPQREVEILHDQLLARFEAAQKRGEPLSPRDVIVMVPDINRYAPYIRAVFDVIPPDDPRHIPYHLADQRQRGHNPLLVAVETVLRLPESRFAVSELLGLLEVPAVRQRFDIDDSALPVLQQWIEGAGIRWGLNSAQRQQVTGIDDAWQANTWQFGLRRLLLGYAVGAGAAFNAIEPYEEIGGLEAQWLGGLVDLLEVLERYAGLLTQQRHYRAWQEVLTALLNDCFVAKTDRERKTVEQLLNALAVWGRYCDQAGLGEADLLPLAVVREAWLAGVDEADLHQRFLSGRVSFCTLMPMRAIPFRVVALLGMNDGEFPRNHPAQPFDLMMQRGQYRPGDRSRRQDDHYLLLEALLSAREQLYVSWVGRSIRDNSERPPSMLIGQLRDTLAQSWTLPGQQSLLAALTVEHPLQPFSSAYVETERDPRLFTYAREWFCDMSAPAPEAAAASETIETIEPIDTEENRVSAETLARFLKAPVKTYCNHRLQLLFETPSVISEDNEPFGFDALQCWQWRSALLEQLKRTPDVDPDAVFHQQHAMMERQGVLPWGGFAALSFRSLAEPVYRAWRRYQAIAKEWPTASDALAINLTLNDAAGRSFIVTAELDSLREHRDGQARALVYVIAEDLLDKQPAYHKVLSQWVQHVTACAAGLEVTTVIAAADSVSTMAPWPVERAREQLAVLLDAYRQGLCKPLPLACRTALVWLTAKSDHALEHAAKCYDGDDWERGEVHCDAYLMRFFPCFASLREVKQPRSFEAWAERLYRPILDTVQISGSNG